MAPTEDEIARAVQLLTDEGGAPGSSLHSWRCEYPERYGPCDCLRYVAERILTDLLAMRDAGHIL